MRVTLGDSTLARQAGRFVWLELNFDKPTNRAFLDQHHVAYTPSLFVLDPATGNATATHLGGMTLAELQAFLDQGRRGLRPGAGSPALAALSRGDESLGRGRIADAVSAYREAVRQAPPGWPERAHLIGQLTWALMANGEARACAETAAVEAPRMPRNQAFARVVLAGIACANQGRAQPWSGAAGRTLEPLAEEALAVPDLLRDHRYQLYQQLMHAADGRGDSALVEHWSRRWLDELDRTVPRTEDERTALDVARVDAVTGAASAERAIAALAASERAMPRNYNASLRLAQVLTVADRYDEAVSACDRGLARPAGPVGRTWLLETKAQALIAKGDSAGARRVLADAMTSARAIVTPQNRENNLRRVARLFAMSGGPGR